MKKLYTICAALSLVAFVGCDNILDKEPIDQFTKDNFFTSETNVSSFANYFYNEFTGYGTGGGSGAFYFNTLNDDQASSGFTEWTFKTAPATVGLWSSSYENLRRANLLIEQVPNVSSMDDAAKNNWLGVGRLYRAIQHYNLVRAFGDIIYVDKVLDVTDEDKELYLYGNRMDRDEVMDKVLEDLNFAVSNITMNASSRVAFNAAVAQAIKSEICLYEGTFCKYRSTADGQKAPDAARANKFLTESKNASQAIMNNTMYQLNGNYRANYNSIDLAGNKEMILYKHYIQGGMAHATIDFTCTSTMQSGMSKAAFDSYLFKDGKPLATTSENKSDHPIMNNKGDLDISSLLAVRDPRLKMQVDSVLMYKGNGYIRYNSGMETTSSTGYGVMKFDTDKMAANLRTSATNYTDAPIYWLANIYLNYAEACAELGSISQSDLDASINKLRARVGMPNMTTSPEADPANNMGVSNLIWEIRRERRVELMFDNNDRYWSLIRWHQLDKLDTNKYPDQVLGAYVKDDAIAGTADGIKITANGYADARSSDANKVRTYDKKHYLYPIPTGQITLYESAGKTLTQNPGW